MGSINICTGDGKGKTTSMIGTIIRAQGQGLQCLVFQFLKGHQDNGEVRTLHKLNIEHYKTGHDKIVMNSNKTAEDIAEAYRGFTQLKQLVKDNDYDVIGIDELLPVLQLGLLDIDEVLSWLVEASETIDIIMTGRLFDEEKRTKLFAKADLVSDIKSVKHMFNPRCEACNIEYSFRYKFCPTCGSRLTEYRPARRGIEF